MKSFLRRTALACLLAFGAIALWSSTAGAQTITISNLWSISTTNGRPYLTNSAAGSYTERGATYSAFRNHAYIVSRATTPPTVAILDGDTGAHIGALNVTGVIPQGSPNGTFALSTIGVSGDGDIYAANLTVSVANGPFRIYRWTNEVDPPVLVYSGNPSANRYGEAIDVRGSGANTEIIASANGAAIVTIIKPVDDTMLVFTNTQIAVSGLGAAGDLTKGITFGPTNTFFGKNNGVTSIRFCRYDLAGGTATVLSSFSTTVGVAPIDVDPANQLLVGVETANAATPHVLRVFDYSAGSLSQVFSTNFPAPGSNNGNFVGQVQIAGGRIFALDTQNGVVMLGYSINNTPAPPSVTQQPPNTTIVEGGYGTITVGAGGVKPLFYQWFQGATPIVGANTNILSLTNVTFASAGSYSVVVSNSVGTTSSAPAVLTITPTALTPVMTKLWQQTPGSTFYLGNDANSRGIAINPVNNHVIVVSRTPTNGVHVLDGATGAYLHSLNIAGFTNGTFLVNMVACTELGEVFVGNLTTVNTDPFKLYYYTDDLPATAPVVAFSGDPGLGNNQRWGDNMDVRIGPGGTADVLLGSRNAKLMAKIEYISGFSANVFTNTFPDADNGNFGLSCVWGEGDTVWGKSSGGVMRQGLSDFSNGTDGRTGIGTLVQSINTYPSMGPVGVDRANKRLAGITTLETPSNVRLLSVDGNSLEVDTEFFPTDNANSNATGSLRFGNGRLVALDTSNGIIMLRVAPKLRSSQSGSVITFTWDNGLDGPFRLQSSPTLSPGIWTDVLGGGTSGVTVPVATSGNLYFRLIN